MNKMKASTYLQHPGRLFEPNDHHEMKKMATVIRRPKA